MVNSAGINFGRPNEEFIVESDGNGALTSARNAVTGTEYVGGENYKEVFEGTGADIIGNITFDKAQEITLGIENHDISVDIEFDLTAFELGKVTVPATRRFGYDFIVNNLVGDVQGNIDGVYAQITRQMSGNDYFFNITSLFSIRSSTIAVDASSYASTIPTKTTIYHHPMPE